MAAVRPVPAAGGVVWRGDHRSLEVALVHRPRYDDWTLPKGKLHEGETELAAAVREVGEELGATVVVSRRLRRVRYDAEGTPKTVAYWAMRYSGGDFVANDEVDDVRWLEPAQALETMSYDVDRAVLREFLVLPAPDAVVMLVRHAKAGRRSEWHTEDHLRPLDGTGTEQAARLTSFLPPFGPQRIISADPVRCVETVAPAADALGLPLEIDPTFGDDNYVEAPDSTASALFALAKPGAVTVVCSQGVTIPSLIERFAPGDGSGETRKGAVWVLSMVDGEVVAADYYPDATRPTARLT